VDRLNAKIQEQMSGLRGGTLKSKNKWTGCGGDTRA